MTRRIGILGAGLSGSEAALQCATLLRDDEVAIDLIEMRPEVMTPAHQTALPAELVCSNSFKSLDAETPHGCAKKMLGETSFVLNAAKAAAVAAGNSLAVDRSELSKQVDAALSSSANIRRLSGVVRTLPEDYDVLIVATGPLTHPELAASLQMQMGSQALAFYDAIAPVVSFDSLDLSQMFFASRYDKGPADFLNIPLTREEYQNFVADLLGAEKMPLADFENVRYFESCLPIEVLAERGERTLSFGPLRPVGFTDPRTGKRPYAVIQLRREDKRGSCFNFVGFQTKMKYPEQIRVFRKLPGLAQAEFLRLGSIHRNTYIHSPSQLRPTLQWRKNPRVFFAGQLTGAEGYSEAVLTGWIAGRNAVRLLRGEELYSGDERELFGALLHHLCDEELDRGPNGFQPTNLHFGLLDTTDLPQELRRNKPLRRRFLSERSVELFQSSDIFTGQYITRRAMVSDRPEDSLLGSI